MSDTHRLTMLNIARTLKRREAVSETPVVAATKFARTPPPREATA